MRMPKTSGAMQCMLLTALFSSMGVHAAVTDTNKMLQAQPVSVVADTQTKVRREGSVNVGGINWACSGVRCNTMASAAAVPLALCQGLARELGALRSFSFANRPLNGNELQQCNSVAPAAVAALPSMKTPQGAGLPPAAPVPSVGLLPLQAPPLLDKAAGFATPQAPSPLMADPAKKSSGSMGAAPSVIAPRATQESALQKPVGINVAGQQPVPVSALPTLKLMQTPDSKIKIPELKSPTAAVEPQRALLGLQPRASVPPDGPRTDAVKLPTGDWSVTTSELTMTGLRERQISITTAQITMTGLRERQLSITTGLLTMTGTR